MSGQTFILWCTLAALAGLPIGYGLAHAWAQFVLASQESIGMYLQVIGSLLVVDSKAERTAAMMDAFIASLEPRP
jgi:hypothetical protein